MKLLSNKGGGLNKRGMDGKFVKLIKVEGGANSKPINVEWGENLQKQ